MAHALTAVRLLLIAPIATGFAQPHLIGATTLAGLLCVAIATDALDGRVARMTGTASAAGQAFDHTTDCLFVTSGLIGAAVIGQIPWILPALVVTAFTQYVLDSYFLHRQKQLRMSTLGRWNGILYFVPLVLIASARLPLFDLLEPLLRTCVSLLAYALIASTLVSMADRALAPRIAAR
mgnify:CR=1 FL=1